MSSGHEGPEPAHLADHLAALHGVDDDGRALDGRRGRLEPRDAEGEDDDRDGARPPPRPSGASSSSRGGPGGRCPRLRGYSRPVPRDWLVAEVTDSKNIRRAYERRLPAPDVRFRHDSRPGTGARAGTSEFRCPPASRSTLVRPGRPVLHGMGRGASRGPVEVSLGVLADLRHGVRVLRGRPAVDARRGGLARPGHRGGNRPLQRGRRPLPPPARGRGAGPARRGLHALARAGTGSRCPGPRLASWRRRRRRSLRSPRSTVAGSRCAGATSSSCCSSTPCRTSTSPPSASGPRSVGSSDPGPTAVCPRPRW